MLFPLESRKQARLEALQRQTKRLQSCIDLLQIQNEKFSRLRLITFSVGMLSSLAAFYALALWLGAILAIITLSVFGSVVYLHRHILNSLTHYRLWQQIKQSHIARLTLDWQHIPSPPDAPPIPNHPFEIDLDITGPRSLHQLLDTSITIEGSQRLRTWLLNRIPDATQIQSHQRLLQKLHTMTLFRDKLTLHGRLTGSREHIQGSRVIEWFQHEPPSTDLGGALKIAGALSASTALLFLLNVANILPPLWLFPFIIYLFVWGRHWQVLSELFEETRSLYNTFSRLRLIFHYLEANSSRDPLQEICQPYHQNPPSTHLRKLTLIVAAAGLQQNPFAWLFINTVFPWDLFFAHQLNRSKATLAALMPDWLDAWYEVEALNSLANFAYLNPSYIFPELIPDVALRGVALGHPLLIEDRKVTNDFTLQERGHVVIITGSNMAGKSTFLRTLGVNLSLAYAGSPVNASHFETGLFRLYTCIRINDSINDGISYFYAEVKRLKALLNELESDHPLPLFFLIDEIFRGTNNRERLIGSRAYIRALVKQNGLGLIATHDLELVKLADEFPEITNAHFREEVRDGEMIFDYQIRPGPSPTTNALKIMALEGLPVGD